MVAIVLVLNFRLASHAGDRAWACRMTVEWMLINEHMNPQGRGPSEAWVCGRVRPCHPCSECRVYSY